VLTPAAVAHRISLLTPPPLVDDLTAFDVTKILDDAERTAWLKDVQRKRNRWKKVIRREKEKIVSYYKANGDVDGGFIDIIQQQQRQQQVAFSYFVHPLFTFGPPPNPEDDASLPQHFPPPLHIELPLLSFDEVDEVEDEVDEGDNNNLTTLDATATPPPLPIISHVATPIPFVPRLAVLHLPSSLSDSQENIPILLPGSSSPRDSTCSLPPELAEYLPCSLASSLTATITISKKEVEGECYVPFSATLSQASYEGF